MTTDLAKNYTCPKCNGKKTIIVNMGFLVATACNECQGTGEVGNPTVCEKCNGSKTEVVSFDGLNVEVSCTACEGTGKKKIEPPTVEGKATLIN